MSRTSRSQVVDITYDDPRTGERIRERRIQEVPPEELDAVRERELAVVRRGSSEDNLAVGRPIAQDGYGSEDDGRYYTMRQRRTQYRSYGDMRSPQSERYQRPLRRREDIAYADGYSSEDRSRSRRRRHRKHRSESRRPRSPSDSGGEERLWYSMKKRRDGNFAERNFDSSYDGIIAGVAGAAIGAMTARRFGGEEKKGWKTLGGAAVGAVGANAAENWFRLYTEEKEEREERKDYRARERDDRQYR